MKEISHHYGPQVHLLDDPVSSVLLSRLCAPETHQPQVNELITRLYSHLLHWVVAQEFPRLWTETATRMTATHPEAKVRAEHPNPLTRTAVLSLARAGTVPAQICYNELNHLLTPKGIRQDYIAIARQTNDQQQVTGAHASYVKIGGEVQDSVLLIPDPMGATGGTVTESLKFYQNLGRPLKVITLHLIVTPEYLRHLSQNAPQVLVYALRLDRGLSPPSVLKQPLGLHWDQEKGLNDRQYIIPGGGGLGEVLNNSFV